MNSITVDVVLPCYNPSENWAKGIVEVMHLMQKKRTDLVFRLIVVNDGSKKGVTENDLNYLKNNLNGFEFIDGNLNFGKGHALRKGIEKSNAVFTLYSDIDFPYTINSMFDIIDELLIKDADIVVGSRGDAYYKDVPTMRIYISKILRFFNRTFLGMKIYDTQCGLKGFNHKGRTVFQNTTINRYLFDLEFVYLASNSKSVVIKPINVVLKEGVVFSKMNMKVLLQEGLAFVKLVFGHFFKIR